MLIAVAIALLLPQLGASGGVLHLELLTHIGVALVFLLSGAGLSTEKLKAGAANWRLHLFVQLFTFTMFPLLGLLVSVSVGRWLPQELMLGFFYLCVLPSTVSSSIAMRSEEHTSELQSLMRNSYAVFCLKQKKKTHLAVRR